ncbi:hypothetical protein PEX1_057620 [Penicillium expansum]|uniref:Unclassified hydrophobin D n=1 Tax=Penicillium expansum TaxID=27334 RepID=HFBD_PENEN|nr:hypothetical protein PEX2_017030 [Penicillium expansum]KGO38501.1 hypothetical protein PEXP_055790 [Penicillium expansum]KGO61797.1 hypothetical protein PEX2_017030 [Penicillium expansum]KGO72731.1 hypothetical protein PEX1_057620 [Penicillium expansum]
MKFYIVLLALAAFAMAEADPNLEARAGCSQKGKYCNGGTFLCCPGQGSCKGNQIAKKKYSASEAPSTEGVQRLLLVTGYALECLGCLFSQTPGYSGSVLPLLNSH